MLKRTLSRRRLLQQASTGLAAGVIFARPIEAAAPEPSAVTPGLVEAARKEGKLSFYSALELPVAERFARLFEAKYPGIAVRVERSGAERLFQRIGQEQTSRINAVDVANSTDTAHYLDWKRNDWLAPYLPDDVARHWPKDQVDPDGTFATVCAWLEVIGYNTNLVKPEEAPRSYADLLDRKWKGRLVKAHPAYSGAILTVTYLLARELGWPFFEKLAQQRVMQVQSAADPPKKIQIGERAVMTEGNDYNIALFKEQGHPVEAVNPAEGCPLIIVSCGVFRSAPNPNAARLFQSFMFSAEAQQAFVDAFAHRSFRAQVKERPGRAPLGTVKLLKADPAAVLAQTEEIKARYSKIFGV
jgi:iron(III) transport system substrate-binding protein